VPACTVPTEPARKLARSHADGQRDGVRSKATPAKVAGTAAGPR